MNNQEGTPFVDANLRRAYLQGLNGEPKPTTNIVQLKAWQTGRRDRETTVDVDSSQDAVTCCDADEPGADRTDQAARRIVSSRRQRPQQSIADREVPDGLEAETLPVRVWHSLSRLLRRDGCHMTGKDVKTWVLDWLSKQGAPVVLLIGFIAYLHYAATIVVPAHIEKMNAGFNVRHQQLIDTFSDESESDRLLLIKVLENNGAIAPGTADELRLTERRNEQ